jgi:DNA-binding XRE family transcriptional regulator
LTKLPACNNIPTSNLDYLKVNIMNNKQVIEKLNNALDGYRAKQGLSTDKELANCLGVSSKTVSLWRNGKALPKGALAMLVILPGCEDAEQAQVGCARKVN